MVENEYSEVKMRYSLSGGEVGEISGVKSGVICSREDALDGVN